MSKRRRMSPKEKQAKIEAAKKSEEAAARARARSDRTKRIVTIVVCVILVLGLSIPTMGLTVCSQMNQQAAQEQASQDDSDNTEAE